MRFESGPGGAQSVEIRVTDTPVDSSQAANTLLTSGGSSEVMDTYISLQHTFNLNVCVKYIRFVEGLEALLMGLLQWIFAAL